MCDVGGEGKECQFLRGYKTKVQNTGVDGFCENFLKGLTPSPSSGLLRVSVFRYLDVSIDRNVACYGVRHSVRMIRWQIRVRRSDNEGRRGSRAF